MHSAALVCALFLYLTVAISEENLINSLDYQVNNRQSRSIDTLASQNIMESSIKENKKHTHERWRKHRVHKKHHKRIFNKIDEHFVLNFPVLHHFMPIFNMSIGTPPQYFRTILVTDMPAFFVVSKKCNYYGCKNLTRYDHDQSTTYIPDGKSYVDDRFIAKGMYSRDDICINDTCLKDQLFVEASFVSGNPEYDAYVGIKLESDKTDIPSIVQKLYENGQIKQKVISLWRNATKSSLGDITFGGIDTHRYQEPVSWTPFTHKLKTVIGIANVTFSSSENSTEALFCFSGCHAQISSKLGISGPHAAINLIHTTINANCNTSARACVVSCSNVNSLPEFSVEIGKGQVKQKFSLKGEQYVMQFGDKCYSMFYPIKKPNSMEWILGGVFTNNFYSIFDIERNMFGIARTEHVY